ncbi:MAG TPA: DUF2059 domain-containing protein [Thermoanaerobaculia bacterium]|nr:DUF2059 domain-containing protein [Thermoanaerobaculia bacterium]
MHTLSLGRRLFVAVVLFLVSVSASAQEAPASKEQRVRQLLVLMRAGDMGVQIMDNMIGTLKQMAPEAGDEFWKALREKVKSTDLVDMLVPVYVKHLESADVDELIRFYSSPTGQRFLEKQPAIVQESMMIGQQWGAAIAADALKDLQKQKSSD